MKKLLYILAFPLLFSHNTFAQAFASPKWKPTIHETFGKVRFDLYCKTGEWGYAQQFYAANFFNSTFYDIHVKAEFVATLVCGNEMTTKIDFTVKKYGEVIHVDTEKPEDLPQGFGSDFTGMVNSASDKDCPGKEVLVEGYNGNKTHDRITGLGIKKLQLFAIQSDGTEVPLSENGELEGPKVTDKKPSTLEAVRSIVPDISSNKPKTTQPVNTTQKQAASKDDPAAQAQTEELIKKSQNPNNDAILTQMYLGQAQANASRPGGATAEQKKAIADAQAQTTEKSKAALNKSIGDLANTIQNAHITRSSSYDTDDINSGNFWLGAIGAYPANTASNFRQYGYGASMLAPLNFGDFQLMFDMNYIFYKPASISTIASIVNQPAANLSNPTTGAEFNATLGLGYCFIRNEGAVLVLQPAAGMMSPGKFAITNKNVTVSSDDSYAVGNMLTSANPDFIFLYGGYLRFFTDNFGFSLGYITNNIKTYNLSNNGASQIKANFDPGMLSFGITFRLL